MHLISLFGRSHTASKYYPTCILSDENSRADKPKCHLKLRSVSLNIKVATSNLTKYRMQDIVLIESRFKLNMAEFWNVGPCSPVDIDRCFIGLFDLMMVAVCNPKTSVNIYQTTRRNTQKDSNLLLIFVRT
jgi:hypothetical protein